MARIRDMRANGPDKPASRYPSPLRNIDDTLDHVSALGELRSHCAGRYPAEILTNLDVLYRMCWMDRQDREEKQRLRVAVGSRALLEYRLAQHVARRWRKNPPVAHKNAFLALFVPFRSDYQGFLYSVAEALTEKGVPVTILIPREGCGEQDPSRKLPAVQFLFLNDFETVDDYRQARLQYRALLPSIVQLSRDLGLAASQLDATKMVFQGFFHEKQLFGRVLDAVQPSLVYALHYICNPGCLAAIADAKKSNAELIDVLIQHGSFTRGSFHDFKGCDSVILWSEHYKRVLDAGPSCEPRPSVQVIGNPKLEAEMNQQHESGLASCRSSEDRKVVLFLSSPELREQAVPLFLAAAAKADGWAPVLKPHPFETRKQYRAFIRDGSIDEKRIVRDVPLYDLIRAADVVVGTRSTALIEAAALGKPVLQLLPELCQTDWVQHGLTAVSTESELQEQVRLLTSSRTYYARVLEDQRQLVASLFGSVEGAAERIASYLISIGDG